MSNSFPKYFDAPLKLLQLESNCGLITAWSILKYFKKKTSAAKIIELCRHTKKHGTFTIALSVALKQHGLNVSFFSEFDPKPHLIEKRCYSIAKKIGVDIHQSIDLEILLSKINSENIAVVLYNTPEDNGHLSPLLGKDDDNLVLPFSENGYLPRQEFLDCWNSPEIYRQCLIASL